MALRKILYVKANPVGKYQLGEVLLQMPVEHVFGDNESGLKALPNGMMLDNMTVEVSEANEMKIFDRLMKVDSTDTPTKMQVR